VKYGRCSINDAERFFLVIPARREASNYGAQLRT
jgi:hypothetical protein